MSKTLYRPENTILRSQLRRAREAAGLTQVDLSDAIGKSQTFVSDEPFRMNLRRRVAERLAQTPTISIT